MSIVDYIIIAVLVLGAALAWFLQVRKQTRKRACACCSSKQCEGCKLKAK